MKSRLDDLFELASSEVTDADFRMFCPNEPGEANYVDLCIAVKRSGTIPEVVDPDWFEVFGIAQRGSAEEDAQEERFVRFKLFCGAVAAKFLLREPGLDPVVIVNYVCCSLVMAARELKKRELTEILVDVFPVLAKEMEDYRAPSGWVVQEYPFCLLAGILMAQDLKDFQVASELAGRLLVAEESVRRESFFPGHEFLMGLTNYDSLHQVWLALAESLKNSDKSEPMQQVIEELKSIEKWRE